MKRSNRASASACTITRSSSGKPSGRICRKVCCAASRNSARRCCAISGVRDRALSKVADAVKSIACVANNSAQKRFSSTLHLHAGFDNRVVKAPGRSRNGPAGTVLAVAA